MVKNSDGLWEIFTAEEKPQKVGGEYLQAGLFFEEVAPVVEKGKPIQLIDRDGNVMVTLDKIGGQVVTDCSNFMGGLAKVKINGLWGAINTRGELVIEAKYSTITLSDDGKAIVTKETNIDDSASGKPVYTIFGPDGTTLGELQCGLKFAAIDLVNTSAYSGSYFAGDGVVAAPKGDNSMTRGIIGFDGEWIMKPSATKTYFFCEYRSGRVIYHNGHGEYGLVNIESEELIRPKYDMLMFGTDNALIGKKSNKKGYSLYSVDDEKISDDEYEQILRSYDGQHMFARVTANEYVILDGRGQEIRPKTDVANVIFQNGDVEFSSDYMDIDEIIGTLKITKDGFYGLTLEVTGPETVDVINREKPDANMSREASTYDCWGCQVAIVLSYQQYDINLCFAKYGILDESNGIQWTGNKVQGYYASMGAVYSDKLRGKMDELTEKLIAAIKNVGNVEKEGKKAAIVRVDDDKVYFVCCTGGELHLYYGRYDIPEMDITAFDGAIEGGYIPYLQPKIIGSSTPEFIVFQDDVEDQGWDLPDDM